VLDLIGGGRKDERISNHLSLLIGISYGRPSRSFGKVELTHFSWRRPGEWDIVLRGAGLQS
jgi:hypothetical protein